MLVHFLLRKQMTVIIALIKKTMNDPIYSVISQTLQGLLSLPHKQTSVIIVKTIFFNTFYE